jgi:hypothetical protein
MAELNVKNSELRTTREAMRELTALLDQLEKGDIEKIVLTSRGQMRGVLVSVETYSNLTNQG